jgi:hypothetical protein
MLSNDKAFSFGKNDMYTVDPKTNDFKADQRGRIQNKKKENINSGCVLLTFGMEREIRIYLFFLLLI